MKQNFYILIALMAILFTLEGKAEPISSAQALKNAQVFLQERGIVMPQKGMRHAPSANATQEQAPFYVFNIGDNGGFVIASGDDRTPTVLGYSDTGRMDLDSLPDNLKYWLGFYEEQIKNLDKSSSTPQAKRVATARTPVSPMVTCKWDQHSPFNNSCPTTIGGSRCVTGCVATAMAQVMYYHRKYSTREILADIPNYTCNDGKVIVKETKAGTPIDWDNMVDAYGYYDPPHTAIQEQAVADLMFYCGASVKMNYSPSGSGADENLVPTALVKYFDYDDGVKLERRKNYTDAEWETMIYDELERGNPLIYTGGFHAYVVDGHDGKGYVHINWGWSGGYDGYFLLSVVSGSDEETMGGYGDYQDAIFGAVPNGDFPRLTNRGLSLTGSTTVSNISRLSTIPVSFSLTVANLTGQTGSFEQAIGLYKNGELLSVVKELPNISNMAANGTKKQSVSLGLDATLPQGVYTLVPLTRAAGAEKWRKNGDYKQLVTAVIHEGTAKLIVGKVPVEGEIITFASREAKRICVENWDTNGDGELSKEEAAAVTSLSKAFQGKRYVETFDELQFFTGLRTIEEYDFDSCSDLSSIIIPKNVETIEKYAFGGCRISKIFIPKSVRSIQANSFEPQELKEIRMENGNPVYDSRNNCNAIIETGSNTLIMGCENTVIPEGIKTIGDYAFHFCDNLTSLTLPESVASIGICAFRYCTSLTTVNLPKSITTVSECAFEECWSLQSVTLPTSLIEIGKSAFSGTKLESVTIPASLKIIHGNPFPSSLTSIIVDSENPYFDSRDNSNSIMDKKTNTLVVGCAATVIPKSAVAIGDNAFYNCGLLNSINIPSNVKKIGNYAFCLCNGLQKIEIPEGVTELGSKTFAWCEHLTTISLPSTLQEIGWYVFQSSPILTVEVKMKDPVSLSSNTFTSSDEATLYVPSGCAEKYRNASVWKDFKNIVEGSIPKRDLIDFADLRAKDICVKKWDTNGDGELSKAEAAAVTDLGQAFHAEYQKSFDELQYFTGLTAIPDEAFYYCKYMKSITLPPTLKSIGNSAFARCGALEGIVIPEGVKCIGKKAFSAYSLGEAAFPESTMSSITLPSTLESIGNNAFEGCNFKTINIPKSVTIIGTNAFEGCDKLTSVEIPQGVKVLEWLIFLDCKSLKTVTLHAGLQRIRYGAFHDCESLTAVNIPKSVTFIDEAVCKGCTSLETINLSETVDTIGKNAFYGSRIKSLYIPKSVRSIGGCITGNCNQLISIKVDPANAVYDSRNNCNGIIETATNELVVGIQNTVIPSTVTSISGYAYRDCKQLKSLFIPENINKIKVGPNYESPFYGCDNLVSIKVDANNTVYDSRNNCNAIFYKGTNKLVYGWQTTVIPKGITEIDKHAFSDCLGLTSIVIPEGVTGINSSAFSNCENLVSVSLPESLTSWDWGVFLQCHSLTSIQLPSKLKYIANSAYWNCLGLVNIKIPESIERIEDIAFEYCYRLKALSLPSKLTEIGDEAFRDCNKLESVVSKNPVPPTISDLTFTKLMGVVLYVPKGCVEAYRSADHWRYFEHIVEMTGVKGDVNQDGQVDVLDAVLLVNSIIKTKDVAMPLFFLDVNDDGEANISDVISVVNIILSENS